MAGMKVKVKMNPKATAALKNAQIVAVKKTAVKILGEKIEQQEIPLNEGTLQNVATDVDDNAASSGIISIVTQGPYAERLYYNPQYNFNREFNSNAKGEWWEDYLSGANKDKPKKIFSYFYKKATGGFVE